MQAKKVTLTLPVPSQLVQVAVITMGKVNLYLKSILSKVLNNFSKRLGKRGGNGSQIRPLHKLNPQVLRIIKIVLFIVIASLLVSGLGKLIGSITSTRSSGKVSLKGAKASQLINREFLFPLRDGGGENLSDIKFFIDKAESRDEIVVKGKRATSIKGRIFLIVTLKITNQYSQAITMNTKDYLRLSLNGNEEEWLAPDIHNDPVEIQAISTKFTRIGFPINDTDRDLILRVGEINGPKERLTLELK